MDQLLLQKGESLHDIPTWAIPKLNGSPIGTGEVPTSTIEQQRLRIDAGLKAMLEYYRKSAIPPKEKNCEISPSTTQGMFNPVNPQPETVTDLLDTIDDPCFSSTPLHQVQNYPSGGIGVLAPYEMTICHNSTAVFVTHIYRTSRTQ